MTNKEPKIYNVKPTITKANYIEIETTQGTLRIKKGTISKRLPVKQFKRL